MIPESPPVLPDLVILFLILLVSAAALIGVLFSISKREDGPGPYEICGGTKCGKRIGDSWLFMYGKYWCAPKCLPGRTLPGRILRRVS